MFSRVPVGTLSLVLALSLPFVAGCDRRSGDGMPAETPTNAARYDASTLQPGKLPYDKASLILGGSAMLVDLVRAEEPGGIRFDLKAHGEVVEQEMYALDNWGFVFRGVKGESYQPAIPLLRFPVAVGEQWTWGGKVSGPDLRDAKANVNTSRDTLNLAGGRYDAIRVQVKMEIGSAADQTAQRELKFWFVPGEGMVKREFGSISTREPAPKGPATTSDHG